MPSAPPALSVKSKVLADDVMARVYMVRTFSLVIHLENLPKECQRFSSEYYESLGHLVCDHSPRVAFEAIHKLTTLGWKYLSNANITLRDGFEFLQYVEETSIINRVLQRLVSEITEHKSRPKKNSQCVLHAALRTIITVGKTFVSSEPSSDENPLSILINPLNDLLQQDCQEIIRQKTLTAFIWIVHSDIDIIGNIFMKQMQLDKITKPMHRDLLRSLHERIIISPHISSFALRLLFLLTTRHPDKAPYKPIAQLWTTIIKVSPEGKNIVQKVCFNNPIHLIFIIHKKLT